MFNCNPPIALCYPLLWGGGILVDHWSTISSCIYQLWSVISPPFYSRGSEWTVSSDWWQRKHHSSALLALCERSPLITSGFPSQWPLMYQTFPCRVIIMNMILYTREYAMYIPYANSVLSELKLKTYLVSKSGFIFLMHKYYCFKAGNLKALTKKRLHLLIKVYTWYMCLESSYQLIEKLKHFIVVLKSRGGGGGGGVLPMWWVIHMCHGFDPLFSLWQDRARSFWGIFLIHQQQSYLLGYKNYQFFLQKSIFLAPNSIFSSIFLGPIFSGQRHTPISFQAEYPPRD